MNPAGISASLKKLVSSDYFPLFVAVLAGPLFVFPRERWLWALLAVPLVWLGRGLIGLPWLRRSPIDLALAVLLVWALLGTLRLPEIGPSIEKLAGFVYGIIVFYAILEAARRPRRLKAGIAVFLALSLIVAVVGTLSRRKIENMKVIDSQKVFSSLPTVDMKIERVEEGVNPNPLGGTLLLFVPLGLALVPSVLKRRDRFVPEKIRFPVVILVLFVVAVDFAAILFARSFGAWAALLFSLLILGRKKRAFKALLGIGLIAAASIFWLKIDRPVFKTDNSLRGTLVESISSRFSIWASGIEAVREEPLFGVGLDRFRLGEGIDYNLGHAHNQFLHTAAEMGIPALAAYLAILFGAGWMTAQVERSNKPRWMKDAARGLAVGQVGFAVFGLADVIALGAKPGLFFWISLSLITAIYLSADEAGAEEKIPCS